MREEQAIIVGAGPCGMSAAIALQNKGINPLIIEKGNIVDTIYQYPTHQTFFSSSEKLEIGDIAFITAKHKPQRLDALAYYRSVALRKKLRVTHDQTVTAIHKENNKFIVQTATGDTYQATYVIIATGYYGQPNELGIPGEALPKVSHYFKEAHPFYEKKVVVIGGKNSAVDATLELYKAGAEVTVLYRGSQYSSSIKPWILPEFDSLIQKGEVDMFFNADVLEITEDSVVYQVDGKTHTLANDFVFAMTGYRPDVALLQGAGVHVDATLGSPEYNPDTYETNVAGLYIAGVIAAGYNNNQIFIENGRFHGPAIANHIAKQQ